MGRERGNHTLQPTALVHEVFLRMMAGRANDRSWDDRAQFYAAAAQAMRRILVDAARRRRRLKRGGSLKRVDLDNVAPGGSAPMDDLLALNDALDALAERHPHKAELVQLRYFAGLTLEEASKALGISNATADRHWAFARAWLYRHIEGSGGVAWRAYFDGENL
jgi:RNA polymerase sigma factor (TIGR02999 family)